MRNDPVAIEWASFALDILCEDRVRRSEFLFERSELADDALHHYDILLRQRYNDDEQAMRVDLATTHELKIRKFADRPPTDTRRLCDLLHEYLYPVGREPKVSFPDPLSLGTEGVEGEIRRLLFRMRNVQVLMVLFGYDPSTRRYRGNYKRTWTYESVFTALEAMVSEYHAEREGDLRAQQMFPPSSWFNARQNDVQLCRKNGVPLRGRTGSPGGLQQFMYKVERADDCNSHRTRGSWHVHFFADWFGLKK